MVMLVSRSLSCSGLKLARPIFLAVQRAVAGFLADPVQHVDDVVDAKPHPHRRHRQGVDVKSDVAQRHEGAVDHHRKAEHREHHQSGLNGPIGQHHRDHHQRDDEQQNVRGVDWPGKGADPAPVHKRCDDVDSDGERHPGQRAHEERTRCEQLLPIAPCIEPGHADSGEREEADRRDSDPGHTAKSGAER